MNEKMNDAIYLAGGILPKNNVVTEDVINDAARKACAMYSLTEDEIIQVIRELHHIHSVKMDCGYSIEDGVHKPWFLGTVNDNEFKFWDRYQAYMKKCKRSNRVVYSLDKSTDDIMDLLGDPNSEGKFSRKGLVIGDVQSGKTSTYIGLMNKAADSGYKVIILLTGTIEKLRKQTQDRVDEGFIGLKSANYQKTDKSIPYGVGEINPKLQAVSFTTTKNDFSTKAGEQMMGRIVSFKDPLVFVLKKNKSVLSKVYSWLKAYNENSEGEIVDKLLLIDDEADNASINTRSKEESPTAINTEIRKILNLFTKSNYVGFTATPFANIFINPESADEMLRQDLFPKDFIYVLEAPTNYIGARDIYNSDGKYNSMLKNNDDCESYLPLKHKIDVEISGLPISLKKAIVSFLISNVIRDIRKDDTTHRSMLINITRFIKVQEKITEEVDEYIRELKSEVRYFNSNDNALHHKNVKFIKDIFDRYYSRIKVGDGDEEIIAWNSVKGKLYNSIAQIVVRTVNSKNANGNLNYDDHENQGLRIIAVGGLSLSRGLTLEGLMVSYLYRNSKMYDTVMQMGRWFGYRDKYEDLCQIWMSEDSMAWYEEISEASDELREEIKIMRGKGLTPIDFGLGVRNNTEALIVTATNKMRSAFKGIVMDINISGSVLETPLIPKDASTNEKNYIFTKNWISRLGKKYKVHVDDATLSLKQPQYLDVDQEEIIEFLNGFTVATINIKFDKEGIIKEISENSSGFFDKWDVVISTGDSSEKYDLGLNRPINPIERSFSFKNDLGVLSISGKKKRIGSISYAKGGLTKLICREIEEEAKKNKENYNVKKSLNQNDYFKTNIKRNPLLIIYPTILRNTSKNNDTGVDEIDVKKDEYIKKYKLPWMGIGIGIPNYDSKKTIVKYTINQVQYKNFFEIYDVDEEIDDNE